MIRATLACSALALALAVPAHASKKTEKENVATVENAIDQIWNQGNVDIIDEVYGGDVDTDAIKAFAKETGERYDGMKIEVTDIFAHEDKVVAEWTATGTYKQGGTSVSVDGITVSTLDGGVIVEDNAIYDRLAVFEALKMDPFEMDAMQNMMMAKGMVDKVYNKGEYAAADEMLDGYTESLNGSEHVAVDAAELEKRMEAWTDAKLMADDVIARGDKVVVRWTMTGDHAALGEGASIHGVWIGQFKDGKMVKGWQTMDTAALAEATKSN